MRLHSPTGLHDAPASATRGVERQVELEHVDRGLTEEPEHPALGVLGPPAHGRRPGSGRARGPRGRPARAAYAGLMCGSRPDPLASSASGATRRGSDAVEPGRGGAALLDRRRRGPCSPGPRLEAEVASGSYPVPGRGRPALEVRRVRLAVTTLPSASFLGFPCSMTGRVNAWPIRAEPTVLPPRDSSDPFGVGAAARPARGRSSPGGRRGRGSRSARAGSAARRRTAAVPGEFGLPRVGLPSLS